MLNIGTMITVEVAEAMKRDIADIYRRAVEDLVTSKRMETHKCPRDGFSCCSICDKCFRPFCECSTDESSLAHASACERMSGLGCSGTRGEGCPKGWSVKA